MSDRFLDSSLAYQGAARGLGIDRVLDINRRPSADCLPDLSLVIDTPVGAAAWRRSAAPDRIEAEGAGFQGRVAEGYRELARRFPERVRLVTGDGHGREVHARVMCRRGASCDRGPRPAAGRSGSCARPSAPSAPAQQLLLFGPAGTGKRRAAARGRPGR